MAGLQDLVRGHPEKAERFISRLEIVGLVATTIAVVLTTRKIAIGYTLLIAGLSTLSFVYFLLSIAALEIFKLKASRVFALSLRIAYIALAITMMGILFSMMRWQGSQTLMNVGCVVTGVMFLYFTYKMYFGTLDDESHRMLINNLIVRMLPALVVAAILIALYFKT